MMLMVKISAPGKLMLFGEHAVVHGNPCIVTAVNHRMSAELSKRRDQKIILLAPDVGIDIYEIDIAELGKGHPKGVRFAITAVKNFFEKYGLQSGLDIKTKSEFSSEFGFGSSSAVTVCVLKGLSELFGIKVSNRELFDLAYKTVLEIQGVGSGFDVAAAIWGGTLWFITGGKEIEPLKTGPIPLVVGYTGVKADTATLIRMVEERMKKEPEIINDIFDKMSELVRAALADIEAGEWSAVGSKMDSAQGLLAKLGVSSKELDRLIAAARSAGALGAKLSGAGGGDCMIALAKPGKEDAVKAAITAAGGKLILLKTGAAGVRLEG